MQESFDRATVVDLWENSQQPEMSPISLRQAAKHLALLALTFFTATIAGTVFPFGRTEPPSVADPETFTQALKMLFDLPASYVMFAADAISTALSNSSLLGEGLSFAVSLLFILISHEMGHYIACRIYRVDATLPYFIPTPPMIGPAGTFGAFIKILAPMPSRKAVFDIGVAGPIAGFIAMLPVAILGISTMQVNVSAQISPIEFSDPLLFRLIGWISGVDVYHGIINPFYAAAWVGSLVTALNLIPAGQLDGGHAVYAALGAITHKWTGRVAFAAMAMLCLGGFIFYGSPSGLLVTILLFFMQRIGHPQPVDMSPLDIKRRAVMIITLAIFILCFLPFPIRIN